jgi:DNA-binding transcriptional LysR family regulator
MYVWDDVKYLLAVARHGSTLAAGRALGISQSTVHRRIAALQGAIGRELVLRGPAGYRLTALGRDMLPYAEEIERAALAFGERPHVADRAATGVIRLTCPEPVMIRIVRSSLLDRFTARNPGLRVEFVMSDSYVDLTAGEADVAFRSGDTDDGVLVGRKIAQSIWSVYASQSYVQQNGRPATVADLNDHAVVGFEGSMTTNRAATWLAEVAPRARIAASVSSVLGLVSVARSGVAVVPMPIALGNAEADLVRLFDSVPELERSWRILAHPSVRKTPAVAAFFDFVADEIAALKPILTG